MTNLQDGAPRVSGQNLHRIWLWTPIAMGALLSTLLAVLVLLPIAGQLLRDSQRLQKLDGLLQETSLLRSQLASIDDNQRRNQTISDRILNLIAGSGDLSTFLARLQLEAKRTGVQLELFEPQPRTAAEPEKGEKPEGGAKPPDDGAAKPPADGEAPRQAVSGPPELKGLRRETSILKVRGNYPALLAFLRQLETLSVLVVQSDLDLSTEESSSNDSSDVRSGGPVTLKFNVSLYGPAEKGDGAVAEAPN